MKMMGLLALIASASAAVAQTDVVLYSQTQLVTHPGGGFGGADASAIMGNTVPGATLYGASCLNGTFRLADDFTVPTGQTWTISKVTLFSYQTGSTTTSTMTAATVQFWNGAPPGGTVAGGNQTTNRLTGSSWSNIYRTTENDFATASNRPVMRVVAEFTPPVVLTAGTYWVDWGVGGSLASGPWSPPETNPATGTPPGPVPGNALQFQGAAGWVATVNGTSGIQNSFPFIIEGSLGGGCYPDCDGDGSLTLADFGCFQTAFGLGNMYADCDGDGLLSLADFGCFQTKFGLGCP